jgi:hypothetical protein
MNGKFILGTFIALTFCVHLCEFLQQANDDKQQKQEFNDAVENFVRTHKQPKFNRNKMFNRIASPNMMRRNTEKGVYLHELFNFARSQIDDNGDETVKMLKKRVARQLNSNPMSHGVPGYFINSTQCPFTQNITCDSTNIYRFLNF